MNQEKKLTLEMGQPFNPYRLFHGSVIPNCLMRYTGLSPSSKLVWSRLAQFNGKNGICKPSINLIAFETGLSKSTVLRCLEEMEKDGFLHRTSPKGPERLGHTTNSYEILLHRVFFEELKDKFESGPPEVSNWHQGGVKMTPDINKVVEENQLRESTPPKVPQGGTVSASGPDLKPKEKGEDLIGPQEVGTFLSQLSQRLAEKSLREMGPNGRSAPPN